MHELPITESIRDIVLRHAEQNGASDVSNIYLVIGEFATVVDDSVQFYWKIVADNTIAKNATLHFRRVQAEMQCLDCGHSYHPSDRHLACEACGSSDVRLIKGDEFTIEAIDIET